jgi:hypothetical protein
VSHRVALALSFQWLGCEPANCLLANSHRVSPPILWGHIRGRGKTEDADDMAARAADGGKFSGLLGGAQLRVVTPPGEDEPPAA